MRIQKRTARSLARSPMWGALLLPLALAACGSGDEKKTVATAEEGSSKAKEHTFGEMSIDEVDKRLAQNDGAFFVYDCNQKEVFDAGHVPGSTWLDYPNLKDGDLTSNKDATLVFYCANEH